MDSANVQHLTVPIFLSMTQIDKRHLNVRAAQDYIAPIAFFLIPKELRAHKHKEIARHQ
jgi:hypothetical protein